MAGRQAAGRDAAADPVAARPGPARSRAAPRRARCPARTPACPPLPALTSLHVEGSQPAVRPAARGNLTALTGLPPGDRPRYTRPIAVGAQPSAQSAGPDQPGVLRP